jgi:hypothetical protein
MKKIVGIAWILFVFINTPSNAQDLNFRGVAPSVSVTQVLKNKFDINFLAVSKIRLGNYTVKEINYSNQVLEIYSQLLLSYKINKHWQLGGGYGFQRNNPFHDNWRNEHRLVQQVSYNIANKHLRFYNRLRFEERWFSYPTAPSAFGTRARYQFGFVRKLKADDAYWQINNEIYAITSGPKNSFISENWVYSGIGFPVKSFGHVETGIGYNTVVRNTNKDLLNLLLLQVSWSYIFPSAKMKTMHPVMHSRHF